MGDSLMSDLYMASVFGAMRLGWKRLRWCSGEANSSFGALYWEGENSSLPLWKSCRATGTKLKDKKQGFFQATHPRTPLHPSCSSLMLAFAQPDNAAAADPFSTYSYVVLNWGVHENDPRTLGCSPIFSNRP